MLYIRDIYQWYSNDIIQIMENSIDAPYPVYTAYHLNDFLNDTNEFKGILVIESQKYYSGALLNELSDNVKSVGFIVTYEFGRVDYTRRPEISYNIVYNFDYNPDIDHYGAMTLKYIDWFVNKHNDYFRDYKVEDCYICSLFRYISQPIYRIEGGITSFVRRSVVFTLKAIACYS